MSLGGFITHSLLLTLLSGNQPAPIDDHVSALCSPIKNLPTALEIDAGALDVLQNLFYSTQDSETYASMQVTNHFSQDIRALAAVVEYRDALGNPLIAIAFRRSTKDLEPKPSSFVHAEYGEGISDPLHPNETVEMAGTVANAVAKCPVEARLMYVDLEFADGSHIVRAAANWSLPPSVRNAPYFADSPPKNALGSCALLRLRISAVGKYESAQSLQNGSAAVQRFADSQFRKWSFYPGLKNGQAAEAEITVRVCVNKQPKFHWLRPKQAPVPMTLIQFIPAHDKQDQCQAYWGIRPASRLPHAEN